MKKVLKYVILSALLFIATTVLLVYIYKDNIIQHFISELNEKLNTPVSVEKIDISVLDQFPYISVVLNNVSIQESRKDSEQFLLKAKVIACALNPIDIMLGDYTIKAVDLRDASIHLNIDKYNSPNYLIFKKKKDAKESGTVLDLNKVQLNNCKVSYKNNYSNQYISFISEDTDASVRVSGPVYYIKTKGDVLIDQILVNDQNYLDGISLILDTDFIYNQHQRSIDINTAKVNYQNSSFDISGEYQFEQSNLKLLVNSQATNLTILKDLIPPRYLESLTPYKYSADARFQLAIAGKIRKNELPPLNISFDLTNAQLIDKAHFTNIDQASIQGYYQNYPNDSLSIEATNGLLNEKPFSSDLSLTHFENPMMNLIFKGDVEGSTIKPWLSLPQIDSISGEITLDFSLIGKINDLKHRRTIPNVRTSGDIIMKDFNVSLTSGAYELKQLNGNFIFDNNDLAISGFSGLIGESDFELTGLIKNFLVFSMLDNQPIGIEADFSSSYINMDQLLSGQNFNDQLDQSYHFAISRLLYMKLNCNIDHLKFRRFNGSQINGDLTVQNQTATSNKISVTTMGGSIDVLGSINAETDSIFVSSTMDLSKIHIDSLFYVFENFDQDFLTNQHLKGIVDAHIVNRVSFDKSLMVNPPSITADINTTIINGELNNFEPMQNLDKYLDNGNLDRLRFAELENDIHVENQTIYLPSMEINNNVSNIKISGTHTFDQQINYRVVAPINNRNKVDKDAAFGAIETSQSGQTKIFLKIIGTTDDYKITYDRSALKKEVISDLKREVQQLKEAFRKKGKKKKEEVELEEEDYFDW
jgi:hypothetical protein